ncbi:MAG: hypothetical protein B6D78_05815 [gamma proteobacterium symbiont of Ctena orbiculata]|nr:MAG: hypothetical protein B6D78_05815 [gamma proteobacterium symbiont of Ctena orbiculata]
MNIIKNILVTDGNSRAALAVTRSLGSKGYKVFVADSAETSLASNSKYCSQAVVYPDPVNNLNEFCSSIKKIVNEFNIDLIIPVTDVCVFPISKLFKDNEINCITPIASDETVSLAANKSKLIKVAEELGINVPNSQIIESKNDISIDYADITYPIVIKPSRSRVMIDGKWHFTSVTYAKTEEELATILNNTHQEIYPIILQERVLGNGVGAFYCYKHGKCIAKFAHKRIREKPPSGGVSVLRESVEIDPLIDKHSQLLLSHLNWHGVAMVEYKKDVNRGIPYFMEINGRFWGSLQLAIDAGVDFPDHLVSISKNIEISDAQTYKVGIKTRWLWGDIDLLLMLLFKSGNQLNLPKDYGPKWRVIINILNPFGKNMFYEVLRLSDLKPWLFESKQWIKSLKK